MPEILAAQNTTPELEHSEPKLSKKTLDFSNFKSQLKRIQNTSRMISRFGDSRSNPVSDDFTLKEIYEIIRSGDLDSLRELSRYYYRTNSRYRDNIDFLAHLPLYDTVIIPVYEEGKGSETQITKSFYSACHFIDNLDIQNTFTHITIEWLKNGVYFGILQEDGQKVTIQDLPLAYCRTRFKDFNNLNILEFNLMYFENFRDDNYRLEVLSSFPEIVQKAWRLWKTKKIKDTWVMIPAALGGVCFTFTHDQIPLLVASIPDLKKLNDAIEREEKRDENELYKLLIQQMPLDDSGELAFELEEVGEMHASVAEMLADVDTVEVLTTFGKTSLENLQDSTAASQSADRLKKYKDNVYDVLGRGEILFNPDGSSSLAYMIKKDEALMISYLNVYETWIKYHLNRKFNRKGLTFDFEILPTTVFNRQEMQSSYFKAAQYGYSKMFAGVALGIKQMDQISLMNFENDFLDMTMKMVPLQSSYTTSGNTILDQEKNKKNGENSSNSSSTNDQSDTGGRPELPDEKKSEKTQANEAAKG